MARQAEERQVTGNDSSGGFVLAAGYEDPAVPELLTVVAYQPRHLDLFAEHFPGQQPQILNPSALGEDEQERVETLLREDECGCGERYGVVVGKLTRGGWDPESRRAYTVLPAASSEPTGVALAAVIEDPTTPEVFSLVAYRPADLHLLATQFPGCASHILGTEVLSERALAEVRALLKLAADKGLRDGVVVGTTDGEDGWVSWGLGFFAPQPGPVPVLPGGAGVAG